MSRFTLIAVIALALLLVAATAVFAEGRTPGYGRSMMQAPAGSTPPTTPAPGGTGTTTGPGMMGNGTGAGPGMMGNGTGTGPGMMGNGSGPGSQEMQAAHEAMQNGDWDAMRNACQSALEKSGTTTEQGNQNQPSSARGPRGRTGSIT